MAALHTPGPWKARNYRADGKNHGNAQPGSIWIDCDAWTSKKPTARCLGGTVAEVYARGTGSADPAVQEANARLIAAAPDYHAAAREAYDFLSSRYQNLSTGAWDDDDAALVASGLLAAIAKAEGRS